MHNCQGLTKSGAACTRVLKEENQRFCFQHKDQEEERKTKPRKPQTDVSHSKFIVPALKHKGKCDLTEYKWLGEGTSATAICLNAECTKVMKTSLHWDDGYDDEATLAKQYAAFETALSRRMGAIGVGPQIFDAYVCDYEEDRIRIAIELERLHRPTRKDYEDTVFLQSLLKQIERMHEGGVIHLDLYPKNIMKRASGEPMIIDYGLSFIQKTPIPASLRLVDFVSLAEGCPFNEPDAELTPASLQVFRDYITSHFTQADIEQARQWRCHDPRVQGKTRAPDCVGFYRAVFENLPDGFMRDYPTMVKGTAAWNSRCRTADNKVGSVHREIQRMIDEMMGQ